MKKLLLVGFCALLLCLTQAYAQNRTITGTVTAKDDGLPLAGVAVRVQGNQTGVATSVDGKFTIKVPSENSVLVFSYIGYVPQSVPVSGKLMLNVLLAPTLNELSEVVVTGVGTATEKRRVPIEVATVSNKDFAKSATTDVTQALTGQIAGAQIQSTSGQPGQTPVIILRGFTNLGSSQPLILIDGVQSNNDLLTSLDPNTVDHIEVVKGSAGGMLYGAQGGNGVIQVFTKKGIEGRLVIDFSTKASMDEALTGNRPLQAQYNHYVTNAAGQILDQNGNVLVQGADGTWPDPQIDVSGPNVVNNKPFNLPTYDHVNELYRKAYTFTNSLSIRGGTEKADYAFNLSNLQQQDVYSTNYNRTNLGMNLGFTPVKGLTIRNNTQIIYTDNSLLGGVGTGFNGIQSYQFINLKAIDPQTGKYVIKPNDNIDGNNFIAERQWHSNNTKTPRIIENIGANYKFPKFVELDYKYSLDVRRSDQDNYYLNQQNSGSSTFYGPSLQGSITDTYDQHVTQYQIASAFIRFDFKNDFHLGIPLRTITQVSYDARNDTERQYYLQGNNLPPYPPADIAGAIAKTGSDFSQSTLLYGYLVNQTIDWGNLFGISGGFRSDYASVFGAGSKPFTFPRGTAYFNVSELLKAPWLANWKLRGAYGEAGVQPGAYDRQLTLTPGNLGTTGVSLVSPDQATNPNLAVQTTKELEIGTDVTINPAGASKWFSRITFAGSYWKRTSENDIQFASVAPSSGFGSREDNLVSLSSHGIDLSADFDTYKSENFGWNLGLRFATARTMVTKINNGLPVVIGDFELAQGQQVGVFYGQSPLHSLTQTDHGTPYITAANQQFYTLVNGNVVDTRTNAPVLTAADDLGVIGNSNPKFTSSVINRFTIMKKLGVSFQVDWNYGGQIYNQTRQWLYRDELSKDFDQPVTIAGKTGAFVNYYEGFYNALNPTSWFVESGSYARLRDASISYDLTSAVNQKWLRSLVVTVSGRNLLTISKYHGLDPEATGSTDSEGNNLGNIGQYRGVDYFGVPNLRSYQFSLNVGF